MPVEFESKYWERTWTHRRAGQNGIKGLILAAGLGKRMEPLSASQLPKPMFPLGGKVPMAEVWLRTLVESGIGNVSMNLCVLPDTIKNHFRDGSKFAAKITYIEESTPSGTLGGVCKLALGQEAKRLPCDGARSTIEAFRGSTVIAPSGDIVTNFGSQCLEEMYDIHNKVGAAFTIVLVPIPWERRKDFGTAVLQEPADLKGAISKSGRIQDFREKDPNSPSNLSNASIYMIEMELLRVLDRLRTEASPTVANPFYDFGQHVFPYLLQQSSDISTGSRSRFPLWGIQYDGAWFDVGQKRDYLSVNEHFLDRKLDISLPYENLPWGFLGANSELDFSKVTIIPPVVVGNNCIIEPDVTLGPYAVVGDGWTIECGAHIAHSVLWSRYKETDSSMVVSKQVVRSDVVIQNSIIAEGDIQSDVVEKTVDVDAGKIRILPIDYVPDGPRA